MFAASPTRLSVDLDGLDFEIHANGGCVHAFERIALESTAATQRHETASQHLLSVSSMELAAALPALQLARRLLSLP